METTTEHPTLSSFSTERRRLQEKKNAFIRRAIFLFLSGKQFFRMALATPLLFFLAIIISHTVFGSPAGKMRVNDLGTIVVNSTGDLGHEEQDEVKRSQRTDCTTGVILPDGQPECTLRAAIELHDAHRSEATPHLIVFNIGAGLQTIMPAIALPLIRGAVTIDGTSQPGYAGNPIIEINGINAAPLSPGSMANGLELVGANSVLKGLVIHSFSGHGIVISGTGPPGAGGHQIKNCYIGTDPTGTSAMGNGGDGIFIEATPDNIIGGTEGVTPSGACTGDCNLISGNVGHGIHVAGLSPEETGGDPRGHAANNEVIGNFIGVDMSGEVELGNGGDGVHLFRVCNFSIGGADITQRNIISGNSGNGVLVEDLPEDNIDCGGAASSARMLRTTNENEVLAVNQRQQDGVFVGGNLVGTDVKGTKIVGNKTNGVLVRNKSKVLIGGPTDTPGKADGNVISGNEGNGVIISGDKANKDILVSGNIIGLNAEGNESLPNTQNGILIEDKASNITIGGNTAKDRNIISGNKEDGIRISDVNKRNYIFGNFIGIDLQGKKALPNQKDGISIGFASNQLIGDSTNKAGTPPGNVISGNERNGIILGDENEVRGNIIGLNIDGNTKIPNENGVLISGAENTIGSLITPQARNIISGNRSNGIGIVGENAKHNAIWQNFIGPDINGENSVGNDFHGIFIVEQANNNTIKNNSIKYNKDSGVGERNAGRGNKTNDPNSIAFNGSLGIDIGLDGVTPNDLDDTDDVQNFPEIDSVHSTNSTTTIQGTFNSKPNRTYTLEFFSNSETDPSGFGEGEVFIGDTQLTMDGNGNADFDVSFPVAVQAGHFITATATDDTPDGSTSEFSEAVEVTVPGKEIADLELEKEVDNSSPQAGEQVTFVVTVLNKGPDAAMGIEVKDSPTDSLIFDTVTPSQGSYDANTGVWMVGSLNNGDSATLTLTLTIMQEGIITNTAEVTASDQTDPDSTPNNGDENEDDQASVSVEGHTQQTVVSFTLVNAKTDVDIPGYAPLTEGAVIDLEQTGERLNIRANTSPEKVGSVVFTLDGNTFRTENVPPYALAGDKPPGDYFPWTPALGAHILTATPYSEAMGRGNAGTSLSISFEVIRLVPELEVESFTLINAESDQDIGPLGDGDVIAPGKLNIRANTLPAQVGSVVFFLDGNRFRTENVFPYALAGDFPPGEYFPWTPQAGHHTLTAIPYSKANGKGSAGTSLSISFEVSSALSREANMKIKATQPQASEIFTAGEHELLIFPNPALDQVNIVWQGKEEDEMVVEVFDMMGHRVHHFDGKGYVREQVDANKFSPGIYLVRAITKGKITKERLIIE